MKYLFLRISFCGVPVSRAVGHLVLFIGLTKFGAYEYGPKRAQLRTLRNLKNFKRDSVYILLKLFRRVVFCQGSVYICHDVWTVSSLYFQPLKSAHELGCSN